MRHYDKDTYENYVDLTLALISHRGWQVELITYADVGADATASVQL